MTTSDTVREKALALATTGAATDEAVRELLDCCGDKRVPVVLVRQEIFKEHEEHPDDPVLSRVVELLDEVLGRLPAA